jgi:triosephosphate isomerase
VAGLQAIATAKRLGAVIEASDVRPSVKEQVESLGAKFIDVPYETQEEKENSKREYRLKKQLLTALSDVDLSGKKFMVAYEPVWAITSSGAGESCLPADVDDVHGWIRQELRSYTDAHIPLLYGGSVTPENVVSYVSRETVDGVLVGSASIRMNSFHSMMSALESAG